MSLCEMDRSELHALLCELRDERLTDEGRQRLESLVINEPEARSLYVRALHLYAELQWISQREEVSPSRWSLAVEACMPAEEPVVVMLPGLKCQELLAEVSRGPINRSLRRFVSSRALMTTIWGGLIGCFLLVFALVPLSREWFFHPWDNTDNSHIEDAIAVGTVAATRGLPSGLSTAMQPGAVIPAGRSYDLPSGRMELTLKRGARVAIEGPASWQFESDQRLRLVAGRLAAHVPPSASGFTVSTPTAEFIDVGTEFVVEVRSDRTSHLAVLTGMVELVLLEDAPRGSRPAAGNPQTVIAGEAIAVTPTPNGAAVAKPMPYDAAVANQVAVPGKAHVDAANGRPEYVALHLPAPLIGARSPDKKRPPFNLARQFTVEQPITITNLGAFDSGQDGLLEEIPVSIYTYSENVVDNPPKLVIQAKVTTDNSTLLPDSAYRFLNEPPRPVTLEPGTYLIVGSNYGTATTEPYINDYYKMPSGKPFPAPTTDTGEGRIRFGDSYFSSFVKSQTYPDKIDVNEMNYYSAASFVFKAAEEATHKQ